MRFVRFVCSFAILISPLVLAQSGRAPVVNPPNGQPIAQKAHLPLPPNPSQMSQGAPSAPRRPTGLKASTTRRRASPIQGGLDFAPAVTYGSGGYRATSVAVADVNGDGKPDLLVANCAVIPSNSCGSLDGSVGVLLGNGDGTFQTAVPYDSGGKGAYSVAVADVNDDGKLDILVANEVSDNVGVLLGNGDGTFQTAVTYGSGGVDAFSVAVADVNGDGKLDLLVANACATSGCDNGGVGVLLGKGDGTFQTAVTYGSGGNDALSVAVVDVNGDGKPDLVVGNECASYYNCATGSVSVLLGNGDATFQTAVTYESGGTQVFSVAASDVNGDGHPDLLVANACATNNCTDGLVGVLLGNGDGTFQTAVTYNAVSDCESIAVADVNGDGKPDLIVVSVDTDGPLGVLLGNGDGTFQTAVIYDRGGTDGYRVGVAVADVNGDGKPDLLVANNCPSDGNCNSGGVVGVLINISTDATTTTLTSSQNPSNFGQPVTFTAQVTGQQGFYKGTPTGTVSFYDGTMNIGNSNLKSSGVATLTTSRLSVGTHSITATYNGDANFASSTSPVLYQVVQGGIAVLSPTSLNFGSQTVGIASSPQKVTLKNAGNIDLTITSIQITGTNSDDYGEKNNCPSSLPPSNSCQVSVTFKPKTTGTRDAAISITDNAPNSPQSVPLTGVGVLPAVTFSPTSLTFPVQLIFTTSKPQPVQLTNSGLGILLISKISVDGRFRQTNNCPSRLSPSAYCTINVKFSPKTKGVQDGSVNVKDNAPGSPQKVPLTGTGTFVQHLPTKLNFGTQPVGTRSLAKKITLTNKGDAAVSITSILITGTDAGDFAETNNCGKQLASGGSCFIKVTFKPLVKGRRTADVSVYDNGGGSPQKIGLAGTGT